MGTIKWEDLTPAERKAFLNNQEMKPLAADITESICDAEPAGDRVSGSQSIAPANLTRVQIKRATYLG